MLIDVIIVLILIYCALSGYRKGLLMSLMGLAVLVLCCLGATMAQNALTDTVAEALEPRLVQVLQPRLEAQLTADTQSAAEGAGELQIDLGGSTISLDDALDLLKQFGLEVEGIVADGAADALAPAAEAAAHAIARALARQLSAVLVFAAAFLILYLVLQSVVMAVNLVDRLPVVHTFNHVGGGILGLAAGVLILAVIAGVLRRAGLLTEDSGYLANLLAHLTEQLSARGS